MKLISFLLLSFLLCFSGCFGKRVADPINTNPAAEKELEKNDTYVPWWAPTTTANGVINTSVSTNKNETIP